VGIGDGGSRSGGGGDGVIRIRFGSWELDGATGILVHEGREVPIQAKPLALLRALVERRDRIVSKAELIAAVWPDVAVSEAAFTSALRDLRRTLGDDGAEPRFVETLRGRGFRLLAPVEVIALEGQDVSPELSAPGFVGREDLLRVLERELDAARAGRGQLAFLVGEAGIGKTRTALELAARARTAGCAVHIGRCLEEDGAPPYRPWLQVLRAVLVGRMPRELDPGLDAAAAEALSSLLGVTSRTPSPGQDGGALRFALFDAVAQLLRSAARTQPRVVLLDDLHRADGSSLLLLRHVARELGDTRALILGTYRPAEAGEPLMRLLGELHPAGTRFALPGLSRQEVGRLVREVSGLEPSPELADALLARTGGNPLFVEEITRALASDGSFGAPDAVDRAERAAPEGVRQVILSRVARLPTPGRTALEAAAVIGREFDLPILERTCPALDAAKLSAAVQAAVDAGIAAPVASRAGQFRFVHILLRDALYDALASERRAGLHAAVGHALEALDASARDAKADALAHHFEQAIAAGEAPSAVRWSRRAGERALARAAYEEAVAHAERALRIAVLADPGDARLVAELLILLGRARWFAGSTESAREAFREATLAARTAKAPDLLARAALGFTGRTDATPGVNRVAVGLLEEALAVLPEAELVLRAEVLARLGTELYYDSDPSRGDQLTRQAVALAEKTGDDALLAYALSARHYQLTRPEVELSARLAAVDRVVALAERSEARDVLALGLQERVNDLLELGEGLRMENCLHAYERVVEQLRQPFFRWFLSLLRGMRALLAGEVEEADRLAHATLALGQSIGSPNAFGAFSAQLFAVRREQGRVAELDAPLREMVRAQPDLPAFRTALAAIAGECGRREESRDAVRQLVEGDLDRFPRDRNWPLALSMLVPGAAIAGDPALPERVYELLSPYAGRILTVGHGAACDGAVDHHLGVLAVALGDADLADDHFSAARALHRRLRSPLWVAHTQREQAHALWKRGTPGDREAARRLQGEAIEAYERMGLAHRVAQARVITEAS
jgi:DNA-binding winged helix-turn-helix (wHTH) protein/tetratricopeptide (TPR) repeat protein